MQGLIELDPGGKATVVTDLHGRLRVLKKIMEKSQLIKGLSRDTYFICTGDFIHAFGERDYSIELIEQLIFLKERFPSRVIILLGNHEWSHIVNAPVYKGSENQYENFLKLLNESFGLKADMKLREYITFFKSLPIAVKIGRIFISHAAPDTTIMDSSEFDKFDAGKIKSTADKFYPLLWARPKRLGFKQKEFSPYEEDDVELFLSRLGCRISIVGHTEVDKFHKLGKQLIVNSLDGAYLELEPKDYKTVEYLEGAKRTV